MECKNFQEKKRKVSHWPDVTDSDYNSFNKNIFFNLITHPKTKITNLPKPICSYKEKTVKYDHNYIHINRFIFDFKHFF